MKNKIVKVMMVVVVVMVVVLVVMMVMMVVVVMNKAVVMVVMNKAVVISEANEWRMESGAVRTFLVEMPASTMDRKGPNTKALMSKKTLRAEISVLG